MSTPAIKFSQSAARDIKQTVDLVLGAPDDQRNGRIRARSIDKPHIMYCKIDADFSDSYPNGTISAKPCQKDGTLFPGAVSVDFQLSGHTTQLEAYCNLKAGDIVAYDPAPDSQGGIIDHMPIVATTDQYAVLQVTAASGGGTAGRIGLDFVRAH